MRSAGRGGSSGPADFVRTLTKFLPTPDFVRTLTTFRPLRGRARRLPFWHSDLRQFCPFKNPSKTEQKRNKTEQNGHQNRKNRPKTSAFCLTYLNIRGPKPLSRPRNGVPEPKKRAFRGFGKRKTDVSLMEQAACFGSAEPKCRAPRDRAVQKQGPRLARSRGLSLRRCLTLRCV